MIDGASPLKSLIRAIQGFEDTFDKGCDKLFRNMPWYSPVFLASLLYACFKIGFFMSQAFFGGLIDTYDNLWYHLPTALRYAHMLSFQYAPDSPYLLKGISSPPIAHLVQAALIRLTGSTAAAQWPASLIFVAYLLTLKKTYRGDIRISAALVFFASVPLLLLHLPLASIDFWTNALCAFAVLAADRLWHAPSPRWAAVSCAAVLAVIYSKMTLWPVAAVLGLVSATVIFLQCRRGKLAWKVLAFYAMAGGLLAPLWALHLWQVYGNMFFPVPNPLDPSAPALPINPSYTALKTRACWDHINIAPELKTWSAPRRFFASFFELTRLMTDKPMNWVQGAFDYGSIHHRMGGYNGVTMAIGCAAIGAGAYLYKNLRFAALLLLGLTFMTSFIAESHELRYFMFIPLVMMTLVARICAREGRLPSNVQYVLLPIAFVSPLFLSGQIFSGPRLHDMIPPVYTAYWKRLDGYIAKHGVPDRPFCRPDIGPEHVGNECDIIPSQLYTRALAAGEDMDTYKVAEWCVSDTPKLAPPYKKKTFTPGDAPKNVPKASPPKALQAKDKDSPEKQQVAP
ncbi:MAG: hypothetical protein GC185_02575 [Alphaproteobacteria bacterium]|nr:hypothetical protein [Alphaproteobacteria bacterium]